MRLSNLISGPTGWGGKVNFENKVLRRISGPTTEELHDQKCSLSITKMIRSKRTRWAGHVTGAGEEATWDRYV
jgi:hypothetical protein